MTDEQKKELPYICPDHPSAQIRHEWNRTRATAQLTGASWEYDEPGSHQYFCNECGRELAPENLT
ncbi:MAG: hypothetical protein HMLKMBBP_01530 [Planctomycetes bacterium]|nr:hypothetical protein [Planctomycetota bacterium]